MEFTKEELTYLASIEHNKARYDTERQRLVDIRDAFKSILANEHGKLVISWIMREARLFALSTDDKNSVEFNEGKRSVGLAILEQIVLADQEGWIKLQQEQLKQYNDMIKGENE